MPDLAAWLLDQISEDERAALEVVTSYIAWTEDLDKPALDSAIGPGDLDTYMSVDATRVLAECEAKRRIIEEAQIAQRSLERRLHPATDAINGHVIALRRVVRLLALPYADRPGYREEWRPLTPGEIELRENGVDFPDDL